MDYSMVGGRMPPTVEIEIEWNKYYAWCQHVVVGVKSVFG